MTISTAIGTTEVIEIVIDIVLDIVNGFDIFITWLFCYDDCIIDECTRTCTLYLAKFKPELWVRR